MSDNSFIFYDSFREAYAMLSDKQKIEFMDTLMSYGLDGVEKISEDKMINLSLALIKPNLDANSARRKNGKSGGRPLKTEKSDEKKPMVIEDETIGYENGNHRLEVSKPMGKPNTSNDGDVDVDKDISFSSKKDISVIINTKNEKSSVPLEKMDFKFQSDQGYLGYYKSLPEETKEKYKFYGHVIRLKNKDFMTWLNRFDAIKEFSKTLVWLDLELIKLPPEKSKDWFCMVEAKLRAINLKKGGYDHVA